MTSEWYPAISSEVDQTSEMRVLVISILTAIPASYALDFFSSSFDKESKVKSVVSSNVKLILRAITISLSRKQRKKNHFNENKKEEKK